MWKVKVKICIRTVMNVRYLAEQSFTDVILAKKDSRAHALTVLLHFAVLAVRDTKQGGE